MYNMYMYSMKVEKVNDFCQSPYPVKFNNYLQDTDYLNLCMRQAECLFEHEIVEKNYVLLS